VRLASLVLIAVTSSSACLRFGYDVAQLPAVEKSDAGSFDAGEVAVPDASQHDAELRRDASLPVDAGKPSAASEAGMITADAASDAAVSGAPDDAGSPLPTDAEVASDASALDASVADPCLDRTSLTFCNGFEDNAGWSAPTEINGTLRPTNVEARSGSSALHALSGPSSSGKVLRQETQAYAQQTTGDVWARAWFLLPSSTIIDAASALVVLRVAEAASPYFGCGVAIRADQVELSGVTARFTTLSPFPRDQWTCVELHVQIKGDLGICETYVDMMLAAQSAQTDTLPASGYTTLAVGLEYTNAAQTAVDLYIDDVAASTARIYCN
jgi:hypothetical protein